MRAGRDGGPGAHRRTRPGGALTAGLAASFAADRGRRRASIDRWLAGLLGEEPGAALVAVGGYGRGELLPGSDLDLLLLHTGRADIAALADRIWYPIWDSGTPLDHSVRTPAQARAAAAADLRVALGLLHARHVAGDVGLTADLRMRVLADWRAGIRARLAELAGLHAERAERGGELAFLLEPDLKEARGGLRDAELIHAVAAAWVAPGPGPRARAARDLLIDVRHALHEVTGRGADRLVLQEQDEVARVLGFAGADELMAEVAGAGRAIAYAADSALRQARRNCGAVSGAGESRRAGFAAGSSAARARPGRRPAAHPAARRPGPDRRPLAEGVVEQDGEVVLARNARPAEDPILLLRAAAAAAQAGLPLAPRALVRLADCPPLPEPWPAPALDRLVALLGAGPAAIGVWEALDQEGLVVRLLPEWRRVRNRPQRNPLHTFTVDRHLVETASRAASLARRVARPDLLLIAALLHDIGKGWPGDHSVTGEVAARDIARRIGLSAADADLVSAAVRHHLLLPRTATRRDLADPATVTAVADAVRSRLLLELLHALTIADGQATGPAAWNAWKSGLVGELARRAAAVLNGEPPPGPPPPRADQIALAEGGKPAVMMNGDEVTVVAPDRPGLLWQAARVLDDRRLSIRSANAARWGVMAVTSFAVAPRFGEAPDGALLAGDLRRALAGEGAAAGLSGARAVREAASQEAASQEAARAGRAGTGRAPAAAPPVVSLVDDASATATVVELRAHDRPGLLWRVARALAECGLDVRTARVETLGAEVVDVFYVVDGDGGPVRDARVRGEIASQVLSAAGE